MIDRAQSNGEVIGVPLSEYEQRVLDQLEAQLASEDPGLGSRLASAGTPRRGRVALGIMGVVLGLAVLVVGVAVSQLWVSLAGFVVMFVGAYFALRTPKPTGAPGGHAAPGMKKPGLADKFQKRVDEGDGAL
ncbi:MAG: DUF3040 domain-containing protein [Bifidobacteriaceae bacterium]|jgi:hypothetical protein|nr:DUF3040 domain-containing protein [Bifidobacteriaceae bacterium]